MAEYTKGIKIKTINGKCGEFMSVGINLKEFKDNPINERGYVNFKISKSKSGEWYAVNEEPKSISNEPTSNNKKNDNIHYNEDKYLNDFVNDYIDYQKEKDRGFDDGYEWGYKKGLEIAHTHFDIDEEENEYEVKRVENSSDAYHEGYLEGYEIGFSQGKDA